MNVALVSVPRACVLHRQATLDVGQCWGEARNRKAGAMEPLGGDSPWPLDQPVSQTQTLEQVPPRPLEGQSLPFKSSDDLCSQLLSSLQSIFS